MTAYRFTGPSRIAVRSGKCSVCGKSGKRQTKIKNTVNPWNRTPNGSVRTYSEVAECVTAEAAKWASEPFLHLKCEKWGVL